MNIGKEMLDSLKQFRDTLKDYRIDDLIAAYEKLPAYVTGERFVPGVDEWFSVEFLVHESRWVVGSSRDDYLEFVVVDDEASCWLPSYCGGSPIRCEGLFKTRESAQAEADRLNGEGE